MPIELIITNANDLTVETIGFGDDKSMAERVMGWAWQAMLRDGYRSAQDANRPELLEMSKDGKVVLYMELHHTPKFDTANALRLIHILALDKLYPKYFASGTMQADVIRTEYARKNAKYAARVTSPDGRSHEHVLPQERVEAVKAFSQMVLERQASGWLVMRCPDADMKWSALDANGATFLELVEVAHEQPA